MSNFSTDPVPGGVTREDGLTIPVGIDHAFNRVDNAFKSIFDSEGAPNGLATLDGNGQVPSAQIPSVPVGAFTTSLIAGQNINAFQVVAVHADGLAYIADAGNVADVSRVIGVAQTSATTGNAVEIVQLGIVDNNGFLFTPGIEVFLGLNGALVQTPNAGVFELSLGIALSASRLLLQIDKSSAIIFA